MTTRWRSRAVLPAIAAAAAAIEFFGRASMRREHARRAHLGNHLYAEVAGDDGWPVVFLAGLQGSTRYWNHRFDTLPNRVLYLDALGFGQSPWPHSPPSLDDHLGAIERTLTAHGVTGDITFVAHSFGTLLAAHFAARFPERVRKLILLGTPIYRDEADARQRIWRMSPIAAMFSLQPLLAREACMLMCSLRPVLRPLMPQLLPRLRPEVAEDAVMHCWEGFRGALDILLTQPIERALGAVGPKTILVHGTNDHITPIERVEETARASGARLVLVDSDHQGYLNGAAGTIHSLIGAVG
jgi:3-oxoadipate enol-lactonase